MDAPSILVGDEGLVLAAWKNVFINVWRLTGTVERLVVVRRQFAKLRAQKPGGLAVLSVLEPTSFLPAMSAEARREATAVSKEHAPFTLAEGYVVLGSGFHAASLRMLLSAMNVITRPGHPQKTFSAPNEAAKWLVSSLSPGKNAPPNDGDARDLLATIEAARTFQA